LFALTINEEYNPQSTEEVVDKKFTSHGSAKNRILPNR